MPAVMVTFSIPACPSRWGSMVGVEPVWSKGANESIDSIVREPNAIFLMFLIGGRSCN